MSARIGQKENPYLFPFPFILGDVDDVETIVDKMAEHIENASNKK